MLIFPGQTKRNTQEFINIYENFSKAKEIWNCLDEVCEKKFTYETFNNIEFLNNTSNTQLAIAAHCISIFEIIKNNINYKNVGGNSLGFYIACAVSECIDYYNLFKILKYRGSLMEKEKGKMISVINPLNLEEALEKIENLYIANSLFEGNIILSGTENSIYKAKEFLKAKKVIDIPIVGPFHSPLMQNVQKKFTEYIKHINIADTEYNIWSNISGLPYQSGKKIKEDLSKEISCAISFKSVVKKNNNFILIGCEKQMSTIFKKYNYKSINTIDDIHNLK